MGILSIVEATPGPACSSLSIVQSTCQTTTTPIPSKHRTHSDLALVFSNRVLALVVILLGQTQLLLGGLDAREDVVDVGGLLRVPLVDGLVSDLVGLLDVLTALLDDGILGFKFGLDGVLVVGRLLDGVVDGLLGFDSV
jgi:Zn-dependent protease